MGSAGSAMNPMDLSDRRRAMRHLLDESSPADGLAVYYALYHADARTQLLTYRPDTARAIGYVCLARTGLDLFRPLVTLRLPEKDLAASADILYQALPVNMPVMVRAPAAYRSLLQALMDVTVEEEYHLYRLNRALFHPILNVLVTTDVGPHGWPRYTIRQDSGVGASAAINWQTPRFAEIGVYTDPNSRRAGWGRSVTAALCQALLESGRIPLYATPPHNEAAIQLAESVGFVDTAHRDIWLEGSLRSRP